jgi:KH domain-containing protein
MKRIISEKLARILKNRKMLERELNVKITNKGTEVIVEGLPIDEYLAEKVIDAINFGFPLSVAFMIKEEDVSFEILNIKDYTKRKDFATIRARIIGKNGKTLKTLNNLTNCNFELKDNQVGIIGNSGDIKNAQIAVTAIIKGAKQSNAYSYLEKHQTKPIFDLGLKE